MSTELGFQICFNSSRRDRDYSPAVSQLYIATYPVTVISWTDTRIDARVPALLAPGAYEIFLKTILGGFVSEASFTGFIVLTKVNSSGDGLVAIETPGVDIEVSAISTTSITSTMTLYGAMVDAGLEPVQDAFYEFSPSGTQFASPAVLMFRFNPVEVDTNTLAIYYFDGVVWSSTSILNQTVVYESPIVAYLQGEILHTSLYAMLRVNNTSGVALDLQPETLNLKSKGGVVTGYLRALQTPTECFVIKTVKISAVNGEKLPEPIFALTTDANDVACSSVAVKFSREALASVLSASDRVTISVAGRLESGRYFSADDTMRVIRQVRVSEDNRVSQSAAALEFKLGSVYVYPDPARGGKVPVFHIEVGKADSVKIRVFTVAGQQIHERVLTGSPLFVGQAYAYEYPWGGHIASGVYYYTIEADRAGKKLKTRGRFSVVR